MSASRPSLKPGALGFSLKAAADIVAAVAKGRNLDTALAAAELPPDVRPAVQDFAYGSLRAYGRGNFLLSRLLTKPLKEPGVHALLQVALYRLETRPDDVHTTVNQAVEAASSLASGQFRGLINGVLRNFLRQQSALTSALAADETARWQHPRWWIARLKQDHPDAWPAILTAGNRHPPMTLRINRRRTTLSDYQHQLNDAGIATRHLGGEALLLERPRPVTQLPGFSAGLVSVQDWGAQQAAALLAPRSGQRVLDACAAPGGKTAHLLENTDLDLWALDADATRAGRIMENLDRLGLQARVTTADCRQLETWWDGHLFDAILADVPCSASGVVRRHPDAKWLRREKDVSGFAQTQKEILDALWQVLAAGGRMLYCTCSVFREENGAQMADFLARHRDAVRIPTEGTEPERQLLPNADHDGFYYALLEKAA